MSQYDAPAYIRRARQVQGAFDQLRLSCQSQRDQFLGMVRLRLGVLGAMAGDWTALDPLLRDADQRQALVDMHAALKPQLRVPVAATTSSRALRRALDQLR